MKHLRVGIQPLEFPNSTWPRCSFPEGSKLLGVLDTNIFPAAEQMTLGFTLGVSYPQSLVSM